MGGAMVIYTREAGMSQDRSSLRAQEDRCRRLAEQKGWEVVGVYSDHGSRLSAEREGLASLLADARAGAFKEVLVTDAAPLSRSAERLRAILVELEDAGVKVRTVENPGVSLGKAVAIQSIQGLYLSGKSTKQAVAELKRMRLPALPALAEIAFSAPEFLEQMRWRLLSGFHAHRFINATITVEAVDRDGVVHTWRSPDAEAAMQAKHSAPMRLPLGLEPA